MPTPEEVKGYIEASFMLVSFPEKEAELRSILTELMLSNSLPDTFLHQTYAERVISLENTGVEATQKLEKWFEEIPEGQEDYYIRLMTTFLKAFGTVEAKSREDKEVVHAYNSATGEILRDILEIDGEPELNKHFSPFLEHVLKVTPKFDDAKADSKVKKAPPTGKHFVSQMTPKQEKVLQQEVKDLHLVSAPASLLNFFRGNNQVKITVKKPYHMAYLLSRLMEEKLIVFVGGKGHFAHFDSIVYHYSPKMVKNGTAEFKRQVMDKRYNQSHVQSEVEAIIVKLRSK